MKDMEAVSEQFLSKVWKLASDHITPQLLNMPIINATDALAAALAGVGGAGAGAGAGSTFANWMTSKLNKDADVFTLWFDGIYQIAFRESAGHRSVLCRQLQRLACGQLSCRGHRALSEAHALLNQDGAGPWQITSNDLRENGAANV